jgi:poly-D-alanine transfer protein DltD
MLSERTQNEEDKQAAFEALAMTRRTPAKKRNTPNTELQAAPREPAAKPMTEENDEPSTPTRSNTRHIEPQLGETPEDTEINEMIEVAVEPGRNHPRNQLLGIRYCATQSMEIPPFSPLQIEGLAYTNRTIKPFMTRRFT